MSAEMPCRAPRFRWELMGLRWEYDPEWRRFCRWGVSDGCRGVGGRTNPVTAYLALRRWRKVEPLPADSAPTQARGASGEGAADV